MQSGLKESSGVLAIHICIYNKFSVRPCVLLMRAITMFKFDLWIGSINLMIGSLQAHPFCHEIS